jgi:phosphonoacetaldehyde hydrolase
MPIKAVVFDWAGTMVDFGCQAPVQALLDTFAAHGVTLSVEDARRDMGRAKRDHIAALLAWPSVSAAWAEATGAAPSEADAEAVYADLEPRMAEAAGRFGDLIPGAAETVAALRERGVKIGSGTGYTRAMMAPILPRAAAQGYAPDVVVCAGETPSGRPSPLMLWKALVELDTWPAGACVKVDDAEVGIEEGRAAGCWSVGVAASGNGVGLSPAEYEAMPQAERRARVDRAGAALTAAGAHLVIDSVADLPAALATIEGWIAAGERP